MTRSPEYIHSGGESPALMLRDLGAVAPNGDEALKGSVFNESTVGLPVTIRHSRDHNVNNLKVRR